MFDRLGLVSQEADNHFPWELIVAILFAAILVQAIHYFTGDIVLNRWTKKQRQSALAVVIPVSALSFIASVLLIMVGSVIWASFLLFIWSLAINLLNRFWLYPRLRSMWTGK